MKKCKHLGLDTVMGDGGYYCEAKKCMSRMKSKCPAYHGYTPKPKDKVIKSWAWTNSAGIYVEQWKERALDHCMPHKVMPCTIHIKAKDWKKLKGKV